MKQEPVSNKTKKSKTKILQCIPIVGGWVTTQTEVLALKEKSEIEIYIHLDPGKKLPGVMTHTYNPRGTRQDSWAPWLASQTYVSQRKSEWHLKNTLRLSPDLHIHILYIHIPTLQSTSQT